MTKSLWSATESYENCSLPPSIGISRSQGKARYSTRGDANLMIEHEVIEFFEVKNTSEWHGNGLLN
eukprot:scaffold363_cov56-Cylindrotheca_fusiformis.AAC.9